MVVLVMLVWIGLIFIGLGVSLYFYHQGVVESRRVNKYRHLRPPPADPRSKEAMEEQRFYEQLVKVENGPSRFSLTIAMVTVLLFLGLVLSAIISAFVR